MSTVLIFIVIFAVACGAMALFFNTRRPPERLLTKDPNDLTEEELTVLLDYYRNQYEKGEISHSEFKVQENKLIILKARKTIL